MSCVTLGLYFSTETFIYVNDSQSGAYLVPVDYFTVPGDVFGCHYWKDATDIFLAEARKASKHPTMY